MLAAEAIKQQLGTNLIAEGSAHGRKNLQHVKKGIIVKCLRYVLLLAEEQ